MKMGNDWRQISVRLTGWMLCLCVFLGGSSAFAATTPPTGVMAYGVTDGVTVQWATPASVSEFVLIVRATSAAALSAFTPVDGTAYTVGQTVGGAGAVIVKNGPSNIMIHADTGLAVGTYYYNVYAYDATPSYSTAVSANATVTAAATAPTAPTGVTASPITDGIMIQWTTPASASENVLIIRGTTAASVSGFTPVNGTYYTVGQAVGGAGAIVVKNGPADMLSHSDIGLVAGTYYYAVYAYNVAMLYSGSLQANATATGTGTATPPASPTGFTAAPGTTGINLSWTTPASAAESVVIARSTTAWTASPAVDGTIYNTGTTFGSGTVVFDGESTPMNFTDLGVTAGSTYYYIIVARTSTMIYSTGYMTAMATAGTGTATPPATPTGFAATATATGISLTWTTPATATEMVTIARSTSTMTYTPPTTGTIFTVGSPFGVSGTVVYDGPAGGMAFLDAVVTAGTTYRYIICSHTLSPQVYSTSSMSASATATTTGTGTNTVAPPTGVSATTTSTGATIIWATPAAATDGILITRSTTTPSPTAVPIDGTTYAVGQSITNLGTVVKSGAALPMTFTDSGLTTGTTYHYALHTVGAEQKYSTATVIQVTAGASTSPTTPTGFMATVVSSATGTEAVTLNWATPLSATSNVLIARSLSPWTTNPAVAGTTYAVGQAFGAAGTVLYAGASTAGMMGDANIISGKTYYYFICSYGSDRVYSVGYATARAVTGVTNAPITPMGFVAAYTPTASGTAAVALAWAAPSSAAENVLIARSTSPWTTNPATTGTTYTAGQTFGASGTVLYAGTSLPMMYADTTVASDKTYYYYIASYNSDLTYSVGYATARAVTSQSSTPVTPTGFMASALPATSGVTGVTLSWATPASATEMVMIARSLTPWTSMPAVAGTTYAIGDAIGTSGTVIYSGPGLPMTTIDTTVLSGKTYYYIICSYNANMVYSTGSMTSSVTIGTPTDTLTAPAGFVAVPATGTTTITLGWTAPAAATEKVLIARSITPWTTNPFLSGKTYAVGQAVGANGIVIKSGAAVPMTHADTGLVKGTTYYYLIVTASSTATYSTQYMMARATSGGVSVTKPSAPTGFAAAAAGELVELVWTTPITADEKVLIVRNSDPNDTSFRPIDGQAYLVGQAVGTAGKVIKMGGAYPPVWKDLVATQGSYAYTLYAFNNEFSYSEGVNAYVITGGVAEKPEIRSTTDAVAMVGTFFTYAIMATNVPTSFSATGIPEWLSMDRNTGILAGTPGISGEYTFTISASNSAGTGTAQLRITCQEGQIENLDLVLTATPPEGDAPLDTILFCTVPTTSSAASLGNPVRYEWDFDGNGAVDGISFAQNISRVYRTPGYFCARVTAFWENGMKATGSTIINVISEATLPEVSLSAEPAAGTAPHEVTLLASVTSTSAKIVAYEWDMNGDGIPDALTDTPSMKHLFIDPGHYVPTVRVMDEKGLRSAPATVEVTVEAAQQLSVILIAPQEGTKIGGSSVTLVAKTIGGTGTALEFQYRAAESESWISISGASKARGDHWSMAWDTSSLTVGASYALKAVAQDETGLAAESMPVTITVATTEEAALAEIAVEGQHTLRQRMNHQMENRLELGGTVSLLIPYGAMSASGSITAALPADWIQQKARSRLVTGTGVVGVELSSEDVTLSNNFSMSLAYQDANNDTIVDDLNVPVGALNAYYRASASSSWENIPVTEINTEDKVVVVNDVRMGEYILAESAPEVETSTPGSTLTGSLSLSQSAYVTGDVLTLKVNISGESTTAVDLYCALHTPGGQWLSFGPDMQLGDGIRPILTSWTPVTVTDFELFKITLPTLQQGTYTWYLVAVTPGSNPGIETNWVMSHTTSCTIAP